MHELDKEIKLDKNIRKILDKYADFLTSSEGHKWVCKELHKNLQSHPRIRAAMKWQNTSGFVQNYNDWTAEQRRDFCDTFWRLLINRPIGLLNPPPNQLILADTDLSDTLLTPADAWALYRTQVAQCILNDILHVVSWRLQNYSNSDLEQLLSGAKFFEWSFTYDGYFINPLNQGYVLPAPPPILSAFITINRFIGTDCRSTIGNVLDWCHRNLHHFTGNYSALNSENNWQYRGWAPVSRIIHGTTYNSGGTSGEFAHWTGGCHGTNGFLIDVLRAMNIPAVHECPPSTSHATPGFSADGLHLSHGDDPYNQLTKCTPPYPASELLIDQTTYDNWFGAEVPDEKKQKNIGRQTRELALIYLPDLLLKYYCQDIADGRTHNTSRVAGLFANDYTVAQLEDLGLWHNLENKVLAFGGCANIP